MKDSGERQVFEGGAQRDTALGKMPFHLLGPLGFDLLAARTSDEKLSSLLASISGALVLNTAAYYKYSLQSALDLWGFERLCHWLELGSRKYEKFNWAKGMPFTRVVDSLGRHAYALVYDKKDEDHGAAMMCNLLFLAHYSEEIAAGRMDPRWNDMPNYEILGGRNQQEASL